MIRHPTVIAALLLGLFAVIGVGLVAFTYQQTEPRIRANEREALLSKLHAMVPSDSMDNDMVTDTLVVHALDQLGEPSSTVYRARLGGQPVAVVLTTMVPDGYSGPIKLLVAVHHDGTLDGVRVISHKETPGLGDQIDEDKSDWIYSFTGKSLTNPKPKLWAVKRDGGVFDQFTGATITPRSIVKAVKKALIYATKMGDALYATAPQTATKEKDGGS